MEFSMERFTSSLWSILCLEVSLGFLAILIARRPLIRGKRKNKAGAVTPPLLLPLFKDYLHVFRFSLMPNSQSNLLTWRILTEE